MKDHQEEMPAEMLQKYAETIRHFRGYIDKDRFKEDVEFLLKFLKEVGPATTDVRKAA